MAEILKRGAKHLKAQQTAHTCHTCDSHIRFHRSDIQHDQRDGNYVICPVCRTFIATAALKWGNI